METIVQMLAGRYVINAIPTYLAMRCSARKTNGDECQICADVCPQDIYPAGKRKRPDWTQCLKCGICAANCPDRCITPPAARVDNFLMAVSKGGDMGIACAEDDTVLPLTVSCLAAVSWEQMAYAAINKGLILSLKACGSCEREGFKEVINQNLEKLRFFLGDEMFEKRVRILREGDEYVPVDTGMSRRELFTFFKSLPLDKAMRIMPDIPDTKDSGLFYRAMLKEEIQRSSEKLEPKDRPKYRVKLPVFTDNCFNCGTCVRGCPQKALKIVQNGDSLIVAVEGWRCTGCGICMRLCKDEGISGMGTMKVSTLDRVAIKKIPVFACEDCGKPRSRHSEDGLCRSCAARRRTAKIREERMAKTAAQRAEREAKQAAEAAAKAAAEAEQAAAAAESAAAVE